MSVIQDLERTGEWMSEIKEVVHIIYVEKQSKNLNNKRVEEYFAQLEDLNSNHNRYINNLKKGVDKMDWDTTKDENLYDSYMRIKASELSDVMDEIIQTKEITSENKEKVMNSVYVLEDCTIGLIEDL